jgi:hypothetical protein
MTGEEVAELMRRAYMAGWCASGEGWNGEYPTNATERPAFAIDMNRALAEIARNFSEQAK